MFLSTFGAMMGFAAEMAGRREELYRAMAEQAQDPVLKDLFQVLAGEEGKNRVLMVRARRENVTEMILEPVAGLRPEAYEVDIEVSQLTEDVSLLKAALMIEEREKRFFQDASSKVPLPEVARIFRKAALKKEENLRRLQGLGLSQTLKQRT